MSWHFCWYIRLKSHNPKGDCVVSYVWGGEPSTLDGHFEKQVAPRKNLPEKVVSFEFCK